ncbi:MAG TPA: PLAT/LH2 domain-containing protein [Sphingomicrobium sp.]|jgi:hypothetical protein|nr:PLAT/LH2 domain-containing protein [Sphingomicrobium sp.]
MVAYIRQIRVEITTGRDRGAGTDGNVYLGICGREFRCDTSADDFEQGSTREYIFGTMPGTFPNITSERYNHPSRPPLLPEEADLFPAYIRLSQGSSRWLLAGAKVYIDDEVDPHFVDAIRNNPIWMGDDCGCIYYLHKPDPEGGRLKAD